VTAGVQPFDLDQTAAAAGTTAAVAIVTALGAVSFMKGRLLLGVVSIFVPLVGIVTAIRLAKPNSPCARWFYKGRRAERLDRARKRHSRERRLGEIGRRVREAIGRSAERRLTHAARAASVAAATEDCGVALAATPGSGRRPSSSAAAALARTAPAHSAKPAW
jgi:hypothetical protein